MMDWGFIIGTLLAIIFFITTVILALKFAKKKQPVWAYKTTKVIGLGTNSPPELKLTFDGKPVSDVYRTLFILFNRGTETIRNNDVVEKVAIHFKGAEILREPTIKVVSNEAIGLSAKQVVKDGDNSIELDFLYLDHEDGTVVEVTHTESEDVRCSGNIIGTKEIVNVGEFEESYPRSLGTWSIISLAVAIIAICVIILNELGVLPFFSKEQSLIRDILEVVPYLLGGAAIGICVISMPHYLRCRKLPRWSRSIPAPTEGPPIEAYCFKCKAKIPIKNPHFVTLKGGRLAIRGVCPNCGTNVFRLQSPS